MLDNNSTKNNIEQLKELKEIKNLMNKSSFDVSRKSGWYFLIWGSVWFIGYMITHFFNEQAPIAWIILVGLGILANILVDVFMHRKHRSHNFAKNVWKVIASVLGVMFFDLLMILTFDLTSHIEITQVLIYSSSVCYLLLGIFKSNLLVASMGFITGVAIFIGGKFFPSFLYIFAAIFLGGIFIISGIGLLLQKERENV